MEIVAHGLRKVVGAGHRGNRGGSAADAQTVTQASLVTA